MYKIEQQAIEQSAKSSQFQAWAMSMICVFLGLFASAAVTRLPQYLHTSDYFRLLGLTLFVLVVIASFVENIRFHLCVRRQLAETAN